MTSSKKSDMHIKNEAKIIPLSISKMIDTKFRDYAVYVLESRGIPNFYDGLTPVQRYILMSSPNSFTKTLTVVGKSIGAGYHHGDISLGKAISKLARPFGSSMQILDGYGFFGSEVSPEPAAARYTSVKLASKAADILNKYKYLFTKNEDGAYSPFWVDVPIGITTGIIGIAVGYKSTILPRKLDDIKDFLIGKRKSVKPFFQGFMGNIQKYNDSDNCWLISSNVNIEKNKIEIREIPPLVKFSSIIKKLDWIFNKFDGKIKILDNSKQKTNIDIIYLGKNDSEWTEIQAFVKKTFSMIVVENIVFIKDGQVLVYNNIEQYLEDYKWQLLNLDHKNKEYWENWTSNELDFNKAKEIFINFILQSKRTVEDIDNSMNNYDASIKDKLENLTSKKFTKDEIIKTKEKIKELEKDLILKKSEFIKSKKILENTPDPTQLRGITSLRSSNSLFSEDDLNEINGIAVWDYEDPAGIDKIDNSDNS